MGYYKLMNVTNTLGKRDPHYNSVKNIEFKDIVGVKNIGINPGSEVIIEATYLPVSAQKLRADGFIMISEIDKGTYHKLLKAQDTRIAKENAAAVISKIESEPIKVKEFEHKKSNSFREKSK
jgi:hypothetical protein